MRRLSNAGTAIAAAVLLLAGQACVGAGAKRETAAGKPAAAASMEERWGLRVQSVRQSAAGYMLDVRLHVADAEKAAPLFSAQIKPQLVDLATGAVMSVPTVPKIGSMRSTRKPLQGRGYAMLFANPQQHVKPGAKVLVIMGEFRAEALVVE